MKNLACLKKHSFFISVGLINKSFKKVKLTTLLLVQKSQ